MPFLPRPLTYEPDPNWKPCTCERGYHPEEDPLGRTGWWKLMPDCPACWPYTSYWLRIGVMIREGLLWRGW